MNRPFLLFLMCGTSGCSHYDWQHRPSVTPAERAIVFQEQDIRGNSRDLSRAPAWKAEQHGERAEAQGATRVPQQAEVDINSAIRILIVKSQLASPRPDSQLPQEGEDLRNKRQKVVALLHAMADHMRAREHALGTKSQLVVLPSEKQKKGVEADRHNEAMAKYRDTKRRVIELLGPLWPEKTPTGDLVWDLWKSDHSLARFQAYVQEQIDVLDRGYRQLLDQVMLQGMKLRLEAFLESRGATPMPVHLPGYDTLEQKAIQRHDRLGVAMSEREKRAVEQAAAAAAELAAAANRVRKGEESIREAFARVSVPALQKLADAIGEIESLRRELGGRDGLKARMKAATVALGGFIASLAEDLRGELGDELTRSIDALVKKGTDAVREDVDFAVVFDVIDDVRRIRDALSKGHAEAALEVLEIARRIADLLNDPNKDEKDRLEAMMASANDVLSGLVKGLKDEVLRLKEGLITRVIEKWGASAARQSLDDLLGLVRRVHGAVKMVHEALAVFAFPPVTSRTRVPGALEIPADLAPNTQVELQRTSRLAGDSVTVRATLLEGERELETSEASFLVREFGWHADIQPGVVLVSPLRMQTVDEDFAFAPSVSWLHRYEPWPEEKGWGYDFLRVLKPAAGLHATFLNFFPDKEVEIGLGATLAFFGDWVVFGGGYNLFREDARDGDWYGFVGTSLIPLLQKIGGSSAGGGGERP